MATERHNGKITAMSGANGGAKFEITLPNNGDPQATLEI
jgi:signal transduction histidine kinase